MAAVGDSQVTVDHYIHGGAWNLPTSARSDVNLVWDLIKKIELPKSGYFSDQWVWISSATGFFSFKTAFHDLRVQHPLVEWGKVVWHSSCIPKHGCYAYKAVMGRMPTLDRLQWLHLHLNTYCVLSSM